MTRARVASGLVAAALAALVGFALWPRGPGAAEVERELQTAQVMAADFYVAVRVTGFLDAVRVNPVVCMVGGGGGGGRWGGGGTKIVWKLDDGARVKEGDVILKLDASEVEKTVSQLEAELADAEEKVRSAEAEGEKKVQNARSALKKAEEALELAQTQNRAGIETAKAELAYQEKELDVAKGQLDKRQRLAEERLVPLAEVEAAEDEVRTREFALEKARRALVQAEQDAGSVEALSKMDIDKARLGLEQAEAALAQSVTGAKRNLEATLVRLEDAQAQLEATEVKAAAAGLLLLERNWRGEPLRVGDEVNEGRRVANVIDPAEMWVRCDIGEAEIERVRIGQEATVLVQALGSIVLPGKVVAIDNLARERTWWEGGVAGKKVFAALIQLTERNDQLRPGMGATVDIKLGHVTEELAVPVEAVFDARGQQIVYRAEGEGYRPVPVKVAARNELLAAVTGDLKAGDRVACERPPSHLVVQTEGSR